MTKGKEYGAFRLKKETVEFLRTMKQAFELTYEKEFTNDEFIHQMAASVEEGDCAVWETYCVIEMKKDEIRERVKEIQEKQLSKDPSSPYYKEPSSPPPGMRRPKRD